MTEEERIAAEADKARTDSSAKLDAIGDALKRMDSRLDAFETADKARKDASEAEEKKREEEDRKDHARLDAARKDRFGARKDGESRKDWKARHDADEKAMVDAMCKDGAREDKARADAASARHDAEEDEATDGGESFKKWADGEASEAEAEDKAREDAEVAEAARHDSATPARIAALEAQIRQLTTEQPAEERNALALAQSRADNVAAMFGDRASQPLAGEKPIDYRKRLLGRFQKHSVRFKESRFDRLDDAMLGPIEDIVYADAVAAAKAPGVGAPGQLIPFTERDRAGRTITKYGGDIATWMLPFMTGATVGRINRNPKGSN